MNQRDLNDVLYAQDARDALYAWDALYALDAWVVVSKRRNK